VQSTNHEATHYAVFSKYPVMSFLLNPNIFLSAHSQMPSAYVLPLLWEAKFHTHLKQQAKLWLYVF